MPARIENRDSVNAIVSAWIGGQTREALMQTCIATEVPCGPINTLDRVFRDPHVQARAMVQQVEHPLAGSIPTVRNPILFSRSRMRLHRAPPLLGEDDA